MIGNDPVCNTKLFMYYRFFLGFSQNLQSSSRCIRLLIKLYPVVLFSIITVLFVFTELHTAESSIHKYLTYGEYLLNVLLSLLCKDDYLNSYFTYIHTVDGFPGAKKAYQKLKIFFLLIIPFSFVFRLWSLISFFYAFPGIAFKSASIQLYIFTFEFMAIDMVRLAMVMCYVLLYFRTKVFKMAVEITDFNDSLRNRSAVNKLILMYETLVDSFRKLGRQLKYLTFVGLICAIIKTVYETSTALTVIKEFGPAQLESVNLARIVIGQPTFYFFLGAIVLDLIADNMSDIQLMCIEKKGLCKNERDRSGLQNLLRLLQHRPLHFSILRMEPLTVSVLLSCFSFFVINCIAVMQIKSYYA